ncbi:MAG: hypothetical protein M1815_005608 [Lichina confinis]|nr:MAG: hypothetical protein M1815_005608 [Lichina confinis]
MDTLTSSAGNNSSDVYFRPLALLLGIPRHARHLFEAAEAAVAGLPSHISTAAATGNLASMAAGVEGPSMPGQGLADEVSETSDAGSPADLSGLGGMLGLGSTRNWGVIFNYLTSKWAMSCLAVALILNRTQIYAATRRQASLSWQLRLVLRAVPIVLFLYELQRLLQAMRCQTSLHYAAFAEDGASSGSVFRPAGTAGPLHMFSSKLLYWQDDVQSCRSVGMMPSSSLLGQPSQATIPLKGSLSLLWPLFQALCLGQFVETLYRTIEGREVVSETGMTVFEHSLAFAEAEAVIGHHLGWGPFGLATPTSTAIGGASAEEASTTYKATLFRRSAMLSQFNTTPEVLLVGLMSALSHLTSHVLGVFGVQGRYRLWTTGFWGLTFMAILLWSSFSLSAEPNNGIDILRFPTVCIVAFVPHILFLIGIGICAIIYSLTLLLLAFSESPEIREQVSVRERLRRAQESLQANMYLPSLRISRHDDFFNALLKVGFSALTAASEAVFLNEGDPVSIQPWTWLEEERMQEVEAAGLGRIGGRWLSSDRATRIGDVPVVEGVGLVDERNEGRSMVGSGYSREKSLKKLKLGELGASRVRGDGVGASERRGRTMMVIELFRGISGLIVVLLASGLVKALEAFGIRWRARWLTRLVYGKAAEASIPEQPATPKPAFLDFWVLSEDGHLGPPRDENVDVEAEMRKRAEVGGRALTERDERELDKNIYGWWKQGGWFGEVDGSGDYPPESSVDDDTSSQYSSSTSGVGSAWDTEDDDDDDEMDDGMLTPTRDRPDPGPSRKSPRPDLTRDLSRLSELLDPKTQAQRQEAQFLAHHLRHTKPLTRSQYQRSLDRERIQVLTSSSRYRRWRQQWPGHVPEQAVLGSATMPSRSTITGGAASGAISYSGKQHPRMVDEEAEFLEHLILSRRRRNTTSCHQQGLRSTTWFSSQLPSQTSFHMNDDEADRGDSLPNRPFEAGSYAAGLDQDQADDQQEGPTCVICQTSPRTILVWPCRCLCLCDDCRLSLAMNNFGACVCCRRDVLGFSRIWLP